MYEILRACPALIVCILQQKLHLFLAIYRQKKPIIKNIDIAIYNVSY